MAEIRIRNGEREVVVVDEQPLVNLTAAALQAWNDSGLATARSREPVGFAAYQQSPPIVELAEER